MIDLILTTSIIAVVSAVALSTFKEYKQKARASMIRLALKDLHVAATDTLLEADKFELSLAAHMESEYYFAAGINPIVGEMTFVEGGAGGMRRPEISARGIIGTKFAKYKGLSWQMMIHRMENTPRTIHFPFGTRNGITTNFITITAYDDLAENDPSACQSYMLSDVMGPNGGFRQESIYGYTYIPELDDYDYKECYNEFSSTGSFAE